MAQEFVDPNYPRYVYSKDYPKGMVLQSRDEFEALQGDWFSHPDFRKDSQVVSLKPKSKLKEDEPVKVEAK